MVSVLNDPLMPEIPDEPSELPEPAPLEDPSLPEPSEPNLPDTPEPE